MSRVIVSIGFWQETNTFNPEVVGASGFSSVRVSWGAHESDPDRSDEEAGVAAGVAELGAEFEWHPLCSLTGPIGGRIEGMFARDFLAHMTGELRGVPRIDAVVLLLHGACASELDDDLDGLIAANVRRVVGPEVPIVLGLDHHANVTRRMIDSVDAIIGHRTEPHEPFETAMLATRLAGRLAEPGLRCRMAWCKLPLITHQENFETASGPMAEVFALARELERTPGVVAVSPFPMQPWLDVDEAGWSVVSVTDGSADPVRSCREIAGAIWDRRTSFISRTSVSIDAAVEEVRRHPDRRVLLHDMGDSVLAGATGWSTTLVAKLRGDARPVVGSVVNAGLAELLAVRRAGDAVLLSDIGLPAGRLVGTTEGPVDVRGLLGMATIDEGRGALVRCDNLLVNVTSRAGAGGAHPNVYRRYGVDVDERSAVVVKMAADYGCFRTTDTLRVRVDTPGFSQSDLRSLEWSRVTRPIYGLDDDVSFSIDGATTSKR